jgi:acyl-CoA synthetase (AMP-forming)/AMP-acid ligase II
VNLARLLLDHPFPDAEPLLFGPTATLRAGEARAGARAVADELRVVGVAPGQAVAVRLPNGPEAVVAMAGVWLADAVLVPVSTRLPETEVAHALATTRPAAVVDLGGVSRRDSPGGHAPGVAFVTWTSGTTGRPKAILHTHEGYLELLDRVLVPLRGRKAGPLPRSRPAPNLIPVSLALNAGIYNALFGLRSGAALVIMDRFDTTEFAGLVSAHAIRSTVLPPAAITMLADDPAVVDLAPLRFVRSITAPLSPLAARRFTEKFGVTVLNGYGQAEIGEVIGWTAADAREHPEKIGSVGRAHPGVDVRIGADGELLVRPPRRAAGYTSVSGAGDPLDDRVDDEGYVRTGDVARIDDDGFVWIEGRLGDVINRGGNKVFPEQVEEVLRLAAPVGDAVVVGVPDSRLGEVPVAFVTSRGPWTPGELDALCRAHLAPYKVPVEYVSVDEVPRSEVGKPLRRELAARYVAGVDAPDGSGGE